jgi:hypothetical protein
MQAQADQRSPAILQLRLVEGVVVVAVATIYIMMDGID